MKEIKVRPMDEDGIIVSGTDDVEAARAAALTWLRGQSGACGCCTAEVPPLLRAGLFRWNPCHPRNCWDGGRHLGHIAYADKPGPGVWRGVYFSGPA